MLGLYDVGGKRMCGKTSDGLKNRVHSSHLCPKHLLVADRCPKNITLYIEHFLAYKYKTSSLCLVVRNFLKPLDVRNSPILINDFTLNFLKRSGAD